MTGVTLGDQLLNVGFTDPSLLGALSSKVGLSGRACVIVQSDVQAALARRAAEQAGVLLDIETSSLEQFPFDEGAFNVIVIDDQGGLLSGARPELRAAILQESFRTLAPRGRIIIIERGARGGLGALLRPASAVPANPHYHSAGGATSALKAEGFRGVRHLAERNGLSFFEGVR